LNISELKWQMVANIFNWLSIIHDSRNSEVAFPPITPRKSNSVSKLYERWRAPWAPHRRPTWQADCRRTLRPSISKSPMLITSIGTPSAQSGSSHADKGKVRAAYGERARMPGESRAEQLAMKILRSGEGNAFCFQRSEQNKIGNYT